MPTSMPAHGWAPLSRWALLPAIATVVVAIGILAHSVAWLVSPCVAWGVDMDDFYDDIPTGCGNDATVTPQSAAWGWTLVVVSTLGLLVACAVAWLGIVRGSPLLWWTGFLLLALATIGPRAYVAYVPEIQMTADERVARPFLWGFALLPAFFAALRRAGPAPKSSVQGIQTIAAVLVVVEALLLGLLVLGSAAGDHSDPDSEAIPPDELLPVRSWQAWVIVLTPPLATLAAFHRVPGQPRVFTDPSQPAG